MKDPRSHLRHLAVLAHERLGLDLERGAVESALLRYVDRFTSVEQALDAAEREATFHELVDAVTVQHSWLFRDRQQLEGACSALAADPTSTPKHVWVPACATGEDVYTLLALARGRVPDIAILGTDVHAGAIEQARLARFPPASTRYVPPEYGWLLVGAGDVRSVTTDVRKSATFRTHNLLDPAPRSSAASGLWDLIVCRNVLIYFSPAHTERALLRLRDALVPGGTLVLGASDIMTTLPPGLEGVEREGRLVFVRTSAPAPRTPAPSAEVVPEAVAAFRRARSITRGQAGQTPPRRLAPEAVEAARPEPALAPVAPDPSPLGDEAQAAQRFEAGLAAFWSGELLEALRALRAVVYLVSSHWPAWYYLGQCYDGLGRLSEARRAYEQAIAYLDAGIAAPPIQGQDVRFLRGDIRATIKNRLRSEGRI